MMMVEGITQSLYKGLRGKWKRKDYERLDGSRRCRRRNNRVELGSEDTGRRRRTFWRIKVTPKLRFFAGVNSPKKFFQRLRDAYVKMMLGFANSRVFISGYGGSGCGGGGGGGGGGGVGVGFGMGNSRLKEYDEKVIVEIYKSMIAQGHFLPRDAARLATVTAKATPVGIACSRS